jgi:hypothetical protein
MSINNLSIINFTEVKCPSCGRHIDKFKAIGQIIVSRKCKSCKNNIITEIEGAKIVSNKIDAIENSKDILTPNRFMNKNNHSPFKDNKRP